MESIAESGPSPRARGSQLNDRSHLLSSGSIPACAGKPSAERTCTAVPGVHPRVRGEARQVRRGEKAITGPSPRARGSLPYRSRRLLRRRSIPACAGKPLLAAPHRRSTRVHPRVRGEAFWRGTWLPPIWGPIPACAGKPLSTTTKQDTRWVHPRVRGEAAVAVSLPEIVQGPSPRARGSLAHLYVDGPAQVGPSPRARGSPLRHPPKTEPVGSIPACAGKPPDGADLANAIEVHPRVRGEARCGCARRINSTGPSPRARGSRGDIVTRAKREGSIPACAGKPGRAVRRADRCGVHPRVRGEAFSLSIYLLYK